MYLISYTFNLKSQSSINKNLNIFSQFLILNIFITNSHKMIQEVNLIYKVE